MNDGARPRPSVATLLRIALALFVLAWIFGPYSLRAAVPLWLPFLVALALELQFFLGSLRAAPPERPDRGPQTVDRELYGYPDPADDLPPEESEEGEEGEEGDEDTEDEEEDEEWYEPEVAPRRRPVRRFAAAVAVIGALGLVAWVVDSRTGWNGLGADTQAKATARFSAEASRIAEKPVRIECDEAGEHVGVVQHADGAAVVGGDVGYLTPARCLDLYRLAFEGERSGETARAIAVLAHEAWHLRGVRDEGTTECYALQSGVDLGRRLGLDEDSARQMMRRQLVENSRRGADTLEYRVPSDCRDGGRLDLDERNPAFP